MIYALILWPLMVSLAVKLAGKQHKTARDACVLAGCLVQTLLSAWTLWRAYNGEPVVSSLPGICGMTLTFRADGFRSLYVFVASFMWLETALLSRQYFAHYHNRTRYYFFNLLTLCGVTGMFLADDLFTAFIFFEIMSMASYPWVAHEETPGAMRAAATYLGVAVLGGMVTLMGMLLLYRQTGSLAYEALSGAPHSPKVYTAGGLILFGFFAKAGAFPLHIWLPKAHPVAPAPASALLSGMLTKAGVLGILAVSFGIFRGSYVYGCILLFIALVTMLLGAVLGVFSGNLKRTLACSSMSQIGYILTGIAAAVLLKDEGALPAAGAVTHMLNHSVLKLLLFMTAGAVYMNAHTLDLNRLRGYGRKKPFLHACWLLGALGLAGVPGFNGYVSKTMIHEGLVEWVNERGSFAFRLCEWVFLFAAGLTAAYMLKTYICLFWQKNPDETLSQKYDSEGRGYLSVRSRIALAVSVLPIPALGLWPDRFLGRAARMSLPFLGLEGFHGIELFSLENLKGGLITLTIGTLVYLLFVRKKLYKAPEDYLDRWPAKLDLEESLYRPLFCRLLPDMLYAVCAFLAPLGDCAAKAFARALQAAAGFIEGLGDLTARAGAALLALASRLLDGVTDGLVLIVKESAFVDHASDMRGEDAGGADMRLRKIGLRHQRRLSRLRPHVRPDPREVTDLRYGSYFTNTVTFGLIVCTLGIVFAFVYVFLRMEM